MKILKEMTEFDKCFQKVSNKNKEIMMKRLKKLSSKEEIKCLKNKS